MPTEPPTLGSRAQPCFARARKHRVPRQHAWIGLRTRPFVRSCAAVRRVAALTMVLPLGACSDGAQVQRSAPPDGLRPGSTGDGGVVVVHGAEASLPTHDAAAVGEDGIAGDLTGSTGPRADGTPPDDATSRAGPRDGGAEPAPDDTSPPERSADAATLPPRPLDAAVVEASTPSTTPVVPPTTAPAWALPLLGRYAARTFTFNQDDFGTVSRAEQLAIVEFVSDGDAVVLHSELCLSTIENALSRLRMLDPTGIPVRSEQVRYSEIEQRWSSEGPTFAVGYTREQPAGCAGQAGKQVPKLAEQAWLTSTCQCSAVVDAIEVDDCRVVDPDRDLQPGLSYALVVKATGVSTTYYAGMASNSHFVNGQVTSDAGVPTASIKADEQPFQFGCSPASCINIASLGKACASSFTRVSFTRLAHSDAATCENIVVRSSALFPESAPSYPARCL